MSPVIHRMLEVEMKESTTNEITITDFPGPAVAAFVHYMYFQTISVAALDEYSADLWGLADKYQMEVLQKHIVQLRAQFVTVDNVVHLLSRAEAYGATELKEFCLGFMVKKGKAITKHESALRALPQDLLADCVLAHYR